eukprot:TRINITY_DN812_c0_g1_i1.p1 TRINITY_DN812_c0_g1~~TRINITY_DN812_c0_g1_i1.p1  ORF type:complete len:293 (+),score=84.49 TRINITY_DN812_c0_g1_i1:93-971(+)
MAAHAAAASVDDAAVQSAAEYIEEHHLSDVIDRLVFRFNTHPTTGGQGGGGDACALLGELLLDVGLHGNVVDRVARLRGDAFEAFGMTLGRAKEMQEELEEIRATCPRAEKWDDFTEAEAHIVSHIESRELADAAAALQTKVRATPWGSIDYHALLKQLNAMRDRYHTLPASFRTHARVVDAEVMIAGMAQATTFVISTATDLSYFWSLLKTSNAVPYHKAEMGDSLPFSYVMDALQSRKMKLPAAVRHAPPPPQPAEDAPSSCRSSPQLKPRSRGTSQISQHSFASSKHGM